MSSKDFHKFSADRPISIIENDLLGRGGFAKDLADAISSWQGNDSLVIALHGEWGSGKSSLKNMAVSELQKGANPKVDIIEFSPWEWAAQEKITASFFQEISRSLNQADKTKSGKQLAALLKRYGRYLNTGEELVSGFSLALPTLFGISIALGFSASLATTPWIKITAGCLVAVTASWAAFLKWGKSVLNNIAGNIESTLKDSELSLSEMRTHLSTLLSKRKRSLVIIMDDLDRLTTEQLRMVFQLVKANTEFPNVVFLLLFQRDLVEEKISDGKQSGRDYLEKIIQVPFDIPMIEKTTIHKLLFNNLDQILNTVPSSEGMFDTNYWGNVFHGALSGYFDNLRNVYRFSSTLSFHFSLLKGRSTFEVNPVDLIAIECLRVFEPDVYREISRAKALLTSSSSNSHGGDKNLTKSSLDLIISKSPAPNQERVKNLLKYLFPTIEWALGGTHYASEFSSQWLKKMRICHASNFDKYFQFAIPSGEVSNSDLREMVALTSDSEKFCERVRHLSDIGIGKNALSQFEAFIDDIPLDNSSEFLKALVNIGDHVDYESNGFFEFSSNLHVVRLAVWFLRRIENLETRGNLLLDAFLASDGLSVVEQILQADENRRQKSQESESLLNDQSFESLKAQFVNKLDSMAESSPTELLKHSHFSSVIYRWTRWGDSDKISQWLINQINSTEGLLNFLKAFVRKSRSFGIGDHVHITTLYINKEEVSKFIPLSSIHTKLKSIDRERLDLESVNAIQLFEAENKTADEP